MADHDPLRVTVVAPVAAPYREPLFTALAATAEIDLTVIYADAGQPSWDVPDDYFETVHDYRAEHLRSRQLSRPGRTPVMLARGIEPALARSVPDVIVASEYGPTAIRTRIWAARHGVPHLLLTECTSGIDALLSGWQRRWHRHFARNVDGAITVSSAARDRLLGFGVAPERVTVALQSADLGAIRSAVARRKDGGTAEAPLRVITVGRLVPDKHTATVMRALSQAAVDLTPRRVALDVVGEGFLRPRLEATAGELGLEVNFHGHLGRDELAELYARADVFTLLSGYEPFGVVVREATAAELAIVVSDVVGAVGDCAIDGENAIVVAPGDVSGAAVALGRLLGDDTLRGSMAARSREIDARTAGSEVGAFIRAVRAATPEMRELGATSEMREFKNTSL